MLPDNSCLPNFPPEWRTYSMDSLDLLSVATTQLSLLLDCGRYKRSSTCPGSNEGMWVSWLPWTDELTSITAVSESSVYTQSNLTPHQCLYDKTNMVATTRRQFTPTTTSELLVELSTAIMVVVVILSRPGHRSMQPELAYYSTERVIVHPQHRSYSHHCASLYHQ